MTREEIIKLARALCTDFKCESDTMVDFCNSIIRELKQEPCDNAVSRQAALDAMYALCDTGETLKENPWRDNPHIDAITDALDNLQPVNPQKPCGDAISRQAVLDKKVLVELEDGQSFYCISPEDVEKLSPVTAQPKTGHWIRWYEQKEHDRYTENIPHCKCSECSKEYDPYSSQFIKYCNECGAKMQESEVDE